MQDKNTQKEWAEYRRKVIELCPYYDHIKPKIHALKKINIPPVLKFFLNEGIGDYVFGMYASSIILCRTAAEMAIKYYAIEIYTSRFEDIEKVNKDIIARIMRADLNDLQFVIGYSTSITESMKSVIGEVAKFGNLYVHGNMDKVIEEYLKGGTTRDSLLQKCLMMKKVDYMFSSEGLMKSAMFDGYDPDLDNITVTDEEAKEITKAFPDITSTEASQALCEKILKQTMKLYEEIFRDLLSHNR